MVNDFPENDELVKKIEVACYAAGVSETAFGRLATNDGSLLPALRKGRAINRRTLTKINAALEQIAVKQAA